MKYTMLLLKFAKIFCTELVTVDVVDVKKISGEVLPQVEIPEKWT